MNIEPEEPQEDGSANCEGYEDLIFDGDAQTLDSKYGSWNKLTHKQKLAQAMEAYSKELMVQSPQEYAKEFMAVQDALHQGSFPKCGKCPLKARCSWYVSDAGNACGIAFDAITAGQPFSKELVQELHNAWAQR